MPLSNLKVKDNQTQCLSLILSAAKGHKLMCISFILAFIESERYYFTYYLSWDIPMLTHTEKNCWMCLSFGQVFK